MPTFALEKCNICCAKVRTLSTGRKLYLSAGIASRYSWVYALARSQSLTNCCRSISCNEFCAEATKNVDQNTKVKSALIGLCLDKKGTNFFRDCCFKIKS